MDGLYIGTSTEKGDKGDPGESGTIWFDGHGPPNLIPEAKEGDYYLDLDTGKIYKLKWG
jgi:hypothetical protein